MKRGENDAVIYLRYDMVHLFGKGGHSDDHGGAILPQMLRWVWRDHPAVESPGGDPLAEAAAVEPQVVELFPGFDPDASVDPAGTWTWEQRFGRNRATATLQLTRNGDELSGTYVVETADGPSQPARIGSPEMIGNKLLFDVTRDFNGRSFVTTYQGIVQGDTISGWRLLEFNGTPRDSAWRAAKERE